MLLLHNRLGDVHSFRQQRLPAWQPILTATSIIPTFVLIGVALIVIGIGFVYMSTYVKVFELDYTFCMPLQGTKTCAQLLSDWQEQYNRTWPPPPCTCWYKFTLSEPFARNAYIYYAMSNYYQNHRLYAQSKDVYQFLGEPTASTDCDPFRTKTVWYSYGRKQDKFIVPCGTIANSLFNDTFTLFHKSDVHAVQPIVQVPLIKYGLIWQVDYNRYKNNAGNANGK